MMLVKNVIRKIFRFLFKKNICSEQNSVKVEAKSFLSRFLNTEIKIDIYFPPRFSNDNKQQYPILFLNDGQDGNALDLENTLNHLYQQNAIPKIIVFAFYAHDRMQEYGTQSCKDYAERGAKSKAYQQFLMEEYFPHIQQKYAISSEPNMRAIAGFSLGGLAAFDTAWHYPNIFGNVGVFSGSLWWRSAPFDEARPDADRIVHTYVEKSEVYPKLKYWFQTGTNDETADRNKNGIIDSIDDTLDLIELLKKGDYAEKDIIYRQVEGGEHNFSTWKDIFPEFLIGTFTR